MSDDHTQSLHCLAVDDEPHALQILQLYVDKTPFLHLAKATNSPWEALEYLKTEKPDILFLDIQMEGLSGLQLLDITANTCPVILTTAYAEYAISGYEYQVADYLLKPYSYERFLKAVSQVYQKKDPPAAPISITMSQAVAQEYLFVKGDAKNKFHKLRLADICYVEGLRNYVQFVCKDKKVISLQNLKDLEASLAEGSFMRVHKSFIVNIDQITEIDGNSLRILDKIVPIGSSYRNAFFRLIQQNRMG